MKQEPTFPIIQIFTGDNIIYGCTNAKDYFKCSLGYLDKFRDSIVVDSNGTYFVIEKGEQIGWGTWLWGYNPLMKGRLLKISFKYKEIRSLDWNEFKSIIKDRLNTKGNSMWYPNSKKLIIERLDTLDNFKKVIDLFSHEES